jgi:hypothetical protein
MTSAIEYRRANGLLYKYILKGARRMRIFGGDTVAGKNGNSCNSIRMIWRAKPSGVEYAVVEILVFS